MTEAKTKSKTYRVTTKSGDPLDVTGDSLTVDGLGTRITLEGEIVYTTPNQVEVMVVDAKAK